MVSTIILIFCSLTILFGDFCSAQECADGCSQASEVAGLEQFTNIRLCQGDWIGYVAGPSAQALCATNWHVCSPVLTASDAAVVQQVNFSIASTAAPGCFVFDAAHDWNRCRPCTGNIHEDDIAGIGQNCGFMPQCDSGFQPCSTGANRGECTSPGCPDDCCDSVRIGVGSEEGCGGCVKAGGCFSGLGRVDLCCAGYLTSAGCQFDEGTTTGVVCCADNPSNPCFEGECPQDCCGNGVCNTATQTCSCEEGFTGEDCCTDCEAILDCEECVEASTCAWCARTGVCTNRERPTCFEIITESQFCPTVRRRGGVDEDTVNAVAIGVSAAVALAIALVIGAIIVGIILWRRLTTGEYAEMMTDLFSNKVTESPLYEEKPGNFTSPLYAGQD